MTCWDPETRVETYDDALGHPPDIPL